MTMANGITKREGKLGSRRIFAPQFKLQVLDSYREDADCKGNQRATARKYGIHRRQIQKWLQAEAALRGAVDHHHHHQPRNPQEPVDLSVKRAATPTKKFGYENEAPAPPPPLRQVKLFKPYLPLDNFEEVQLPEPPAPQPQPQAPPPPPSAFERVVPMVYPKVRHHRKWLLLHEGRHVMPMLAGIS